MDSRLLRHYESELTFLREMGGEFAQSYPKIAARLGMDGTEVLDPYVERLLEGAAFLSARVQLELELQYPAFTAHLLEIVYPHLAAPTPSMMVAELTPDLANSALASGARLPRGTQLRSIAAEGTSTACIFSTAQEVTLWPVEITEAEYIDGRGELVAAGVLGSFDARAAIRLRLKRPGGAPLSELPMERLTLFLGGQGILGARLHELFCADCEGVTARSTDRRADWTVPLAQDIAQRGMARDEALLPTPRRALDGYRLLQEYFAMPDRFFFVDICGLDRALARCESDEMDLYVLLRDGNAAIAPQVTVEAFQLNCVPAINLFEKRCDRVQVTTTDFEQHVVVDRTAPLDFEVFSLLSVTGISAAAEDDRPFRPFYSADEFTAASGHGSAYYSQSRKMRQRTERERLKGARTNYLGSEMYVSLVDPVQAPYPAGLAQLAVRAMVSNRDLPMLLPTGGRDVFHLPAGGPVKSIRTPVPPTRPRPTLAQGESAWKLISNLSLNYLSIADTDVGTGAEGLRELIGLYAPTGDRTVQRLLEGILKVESRPIVRRMSDGMLSTAVRGLEITVHCDEDFFEGSSPYLLVSVLRHFLMNYVSINSFTETVLKTHQRGEVARWRPRSGPRSDGLSHLQRLAQHPTEYHVFLALRLIEAQFDDAPRLAESRRPRQDMVRLGQEPSMAYAPATLTEYRPREGTAPAKLSNLFFGLFGPHGPLPPHMTEYARERQRSYGDPTLVAFANMLTHRMMSLLYRAWTTGQPATGLDRGAGQSMERKAAALSGLHGAAFRGRDAMPDMAKRYFAGHMARGPKNAAGLEAMLSAFFRAPVRLQQFVGSWLELEPDDRWRLGERAGLGQATSIGSRVWSRSAKFRIHVGPLGLADYRALLPGSDALARLTSIVRNFAGDALDWDVNLVLRGDDVPAATLGGDTRLGQTSWIGSRTPGHDADDLFLSPMAAQQDG